MALIVATVLFAFFVVNVVMDAMNGSGILGDVGEMLMLFAASVAFVAAILRREARDKENKSQ